MHEPRTSKHITQEEEATYFYWAGSFPLEIFYVLSPRRKYFRTLTTNNNLKCHDLQTNIAMLVWDKFNNYSYYHCQAQHLISKRLEVQEISREANTVFEKNPKTKQTNKQPKEERKKYANVLYK